MARIRKRASATKRRIRWPAAVALIVVVGLLLGGLGVWANQEYQYSRLAGIRDLEALGFDCSGKFVENAFYQSECESVFSAFLDYPQKQEPSFNPEAFESLFEPYPWIWHDISGRENQQQLHAGSRQVVFEQYDSPDWSDDDEEVLETSSDFDIWSLLFATGPLPIENEGDGWIGPAGGKPRSIDDIHFGAGGPIDSEPGEEGEPYEPWLYAGPFAESVVCEDIVDLVPKQSVANVFTSAEQTSGQELRAVVEIWPDYYSDEAYASYCLQIKYRLGSEQTAWMKVTIPLDEFWQQLQERHGEVAEDIAETNNFASRRLGAAPGENTSEDDDEESEEPDDGDTQPGDPPPEEGSDNEESDEDDQTDYEDYPDPEDPLSGYYSETRLLVKTFRDQTAKTAYFVANLDEHPCQDGRTRVIDSDLAVIYSPPDDESDSESAEEGILDSVFQSLTFLYDEDDEEPLPYQLRICGDIVSELESLALECQARRRTDGVCSGGLDDKLLKTVRAVAADCQRMYDNAAENDTDPTPADLADCLQLTAERRQDFIDTIQIVGDDHDDYGKLLQALGYYRFDTSLPYVLWDDWTERTVDKIRFQFELIALHEYLHKIYSQDLSLKERMRFHQEVLALYENDEQAFFEYLGDDNLGNEVKHRINRHGNAFYGVLDAGGLIDEINGYGPQLIEALPAETRIEYAEFLEDRHGIVAFVYALSEAQVGMLYSQGDLFKEGEIITGLDDFIRGSQTKQIAATYEAEQWAEEYEEYDSPVANDPLIQIAARMPLSVRHRGDTSLYGYNLGSTDTDILEHIEDLQKQLGDELLNLEEQLLTKFRDKLRAELEEEYGSRHKRFVAVFSESMSETFLRLVFFLDPEAESDDVLMDQVIEEIKSRLAEIPTENLDTWERMLAIPNDDERDEEDIRTAYAFFNMSLELREHIFTKFGGIDFYLLYNIFASYSGFFAEAYPILALETPARLSDRLEEHYDGYLDRTALAKYFKYAPELDFEPPESEQDPPARREQQTDDNGDQQTGDGNYVAWSQEAFETASNQQRWLYFHADWDPNCQALDADINANLADIPEDVVIFKVDYDNSSDLRQRYGAVYQRTVVAVDADAEKSAEILAVGSNRSLAKIIEALYVEPQP